MCKKKAKVKRADGKERSIQHMVATTFWHPDGTPMSAEQFIEMLFDKLPEFFKDDDELRVLWSAGERQLSWPADKIVDASQNAGALRQLRAVVPLEALTARPAPHVVQDGYRRQLTGYAVSANLLLVESRQCCNALSLHHPCRSAFRVPF